MVRAEPRVTDAKCDENDGFRRTRMSQSSTITNHGNATANSKQQQEGAQNGSTKALVGALPVLMLS